MNNKISYSTNKSFGVLFFIVFLLFALWPVLKGNDLQVWFLIISLIFLILGLLNSKILTPFNIIWIKFGLLLGRIASPIVMGFIYFFVVTPTGVIMKIFGKDLLGLKQSKKDSYWIERKKSSSSMKNQF